MKLSKVAATVHVYGGLFLTPFAILFAVSVFVINHAPVAPASEVRRAGPSQVEIPKGVEAMEGRARIDKLRPLLDQLHVRGEVGFIRYVADEGRMVVPVTTASSEATVDLDLRAATATVRTRSSSPGRGTVFFHKLPGPHLVNIRGNWVVIRLWRMLADATVYLFLLATLTGIILWWILPPLRRAGLIWLAFGTFTFLGVTYALVF